MLIKALHAAGIDTTPAEAHTSVIRSLSSAVSVIERCMRLA